MSEGRSSRVWLFDLDNTLHDASPHIFPHINRSMTAYVADALGLSIEEASLVRTDYWRRFGATLGGMMRLHGTEPQHFLRQTHQFPELARMLVFDHALKGMLRRLPGRKMVFSNAPQHYAEAVLELMGVRPLFDAVYSIERLRFRPKPQIQGFLHLLKTERLKASRCIMVEDSPANLQMAKTLGMKTVLVGHVAKLPAWVDLRLQSVLELPRRLGEL